MRAFLLVLVPWFQDPATSAPAPDVVTVEGIGAALEVIGLFFEEDEIALMLDGVTENLRAYERMRELPIQNDVPMALTFRPLPLPPATVDPVTSLLIGPHASVDRPHKLDELVFADIRTLAALIRSRKITCLELTQTYLRRLHAIDEKLHCVITFLDDSALERARLLDTELDQGKWRGLLHGIPWGAKDLLSVAGSPTTWGAEPFKTQHFDQDATVVRRLDNAGAVLVAKLSLGALAMGDRWFGERTRNPWDPEQGSSGSSAGSASATVAGGVVFALGSETLGSIVSPSDRCGASALRPSYGRVSRHGAMTLSWSMDKLGPICRTVEDAAIVFSFIQGADDQDGSVIPRPFTYPRHTSLDPPRKWRVGVPVGLFEGTPHEAVLDILRLTSMSDVALEIEFVPVELPAFPVAEMRIILSAEAAAAFDEFTLGKDVDRLVAQDARAWPNVFRTSRLIPAVDYIRANRLRVQLMRALDESLAGIDVLVHPSFAGNILTMTNLTGHPTVVVPCGFDDRDRPYSVSFTGHLFDEGRLLTFAHTWQSKTKFHRRHPSF